MKRAQSALLQWTNREEALEPLDISFVARPLRYAQLRQYHFHEPECVRVPDGTGILGLELAANTVRVVRHGRDVPQQPEELGSPQARFVYPLAISLARDLGKGWGVCLHPAEKSWDKVGIC